MTGDIYAEFDENNQIPILIDKVGTEAIYIEIRAYYHGRKTASIYNYISRENVVKLRDKLTEWLEEGENEKK